MFASDRIRFTDMEARIDGRLSYIVRIAFEKPDNIKERREFTAFLSKVLNLCVDHHWAFVSTFDGGGVYFMNFLVNSSDDCLDFKFLVLDYIMHNIYPSYEDDPRWTGDGKRKAEFK